MRQTRLITQFRMSSVPNSRRKQERSVTSGLHVRPLTQLYTFEARFTSSMGRLRLCAWCSERKSDDLSRCICCCGRVASFRCVLNCTERTLADATYIVGNALRNNPFAPYVPCHRVVASDLSLGGFFGERATSKNGRGRPLGEHCTRKVELLTQEGVLFAKEGRCVSREAIWER